MAWHALRTLPSPGNRTTTAAAPIMQTHFQGSSSGPMLTIQDARWTASSQDGLPPACSGPIRPQRPPLPTWKNAWNSTPTPPIIASSERQRCNRNSDANDAHDAAVQRASSCRDTSHSPIRFAACRRALPLARAASYPRSRLSGDWAVENGGGDLNVDGLLIAADGWDEGGPL